jgi:predicted membrane protein
MDVLTKQQESFCENAGLFGTMLSVACLIQHIVFMIPHWISFSIIPVYVLSIAGYILLMKKSVSALPLLLISAILVFLLEALLLFSLTFSLVLFLLLIYSIVIVVLFFTGNMQKQLRKKALAEKEDAEKWNGVL